MYSPAAGTFLVPNPQDIDGRFVRRGEVVGYVVEPSVITVRVTVSQSEADLVRLRTRDVSIRLPENIDEILPAQTDPGGPRGNRPAALERSSGRPAGAPSRSTPAMPRG